MGGSVYIVMRVETEDQWPVSVWSTKEQAEIERDRLTATIPAGHNWYSFDIVDMELDRAAEESS